MKSADNKMAISTDYQLACYLEQNVFLQTTQEATYRTMRVSPSYSLKLCSPLVENSERFSDLGPELRLDDLAANILDDVRFLTLSLFNAVKSAEELAKFRATADCKWRSPSSQYEWIRQLTSLGLHERLESLTLPPLTTTTQVSNAVTHLIHIAAKGYTSSLQNMEPLSESFKSSMHDDFHSVLGMVPYTVWTELPGIWYWILLVACPSGEKMRYTSPTEALRARWLRRKMAVAGMAIALEDFGLGTLIIQRFWLVQRWIENENQKNTGYVSSSENLSSSS